MPIKLLIILSHTCKHTDEANKSVIKKSFLKFKVEKICQNRKIMEKSNEDFKETRQKAKEEYVNDEKLIPTT